MFKNEKYVIIERIGSEKMEKEQAFLDEKRKQDEKRIRMTTQPLEKLILKLAVPSIISMLITSLYNLVDTFFVGQLENTSATGAVGVSFSLMAVIQAFGFFFGHGSGNYISRELGKKNVKGAEEMASVGFFSAIITGTVIMVFGLLFLKPLARFLGSTDTILPYAVDYLRYILFGAPFTCGLFVINNQLRFQSNAFFSMIGVVSGAVINVILDPILIFGFDMGVAGAALATAISQFISFTILLIVMQKSDSLKLRLKNFKPSLQKYKDIFKGGTPSLCRQGLASVATVCLNFSAGNFSDAAIAAIGIVSRIMMFASSALIGFGQGFQPFCGFNYGAALYKRVKDAFTFCVKYSTMFLFAVAGMVFVLAPQVITLFQGDDPEVIKIGALALRAQAVTFPFMSWVVMSNMMTQTIGKVYKASILAMSRQGLMFAPAVLILPLIFDLWGLVLAQPVADVLTFVISVPIMKSELRELDILQKQQENSQ